MKKEVVVYIEYYDQLFILGELSEEIGITTAGDHICIVTRASRGSIQCTSYPLIVIGEL